MKRKTVISGMACFRENLSHCASILGLTVKDLSKITSVPEGTLKTMKSPLRSSAAENCVAVSMALCTSLDRLCDGYLVCDPAEAVRIQVDFIRKAGGIPEADAEKAVSGAIKELGRDKVFFETELYVLLKSVLRPLVGGLDAETVKKSLDPVPDVGAIFRENFAYLLGVTGKSYRDLRDGTGISLGCISRCNAGGVPTARKALAIAHYFHVGIADLLTRDLRGSGYAALAFMTGSDSVVPETRNFAKISDEDREERCLTREEAEAFLKGHILGLCGC